MYSPAHSRRSHLEWAWPQQMGGAGEREGEVTGERRCQSLQMQHEEHKTHKTNTRRET